MSVKDSGAGISAEHQKDLFKEGMQFNANKLQGGKGSGLGLFITKGIVSLHGGVISAFSEGEGKGCTFSIELPAVEVSASQLESSGELSRERLDIVKIVEEYVDPALLSLKKDEVDVKSGSHSIQNILVVDDSSPSRKMVARLLKNCGYTVVEAIDGQKCVDYMERNVSSPKGDRIHMILMDYEMPVLNGPSATSILRGMGIVLPIIGLTGNVLPEDVDLFTKHGANAVLTKPLDLEKLKVVLADFDDIPNDIPHTSSFCAANKRSTNSLRVFPDVIDAVTTPTEILTDNNV